ncbi:serine hydrolase domain-containing protein [Streptomyces sp. NPDC127106]|uniref:serine hydrolase domain-containing protein n=1 Tax=Streptomyces sp. NPDC127106 TaxID=3345360 RepID=UPI00362BAE65
MVVRRIRSGLIGAVVAAVLGGAALGTPAVAASEVRAGKPAGHGRTQAALEESVKGGAGVLIRSTDRNRAWKSSAGVSDLTTQTPRGADDTFRAGSITKTFVATVLLQLEAEGRLNLDDPVERWLPGTIHGNGFDGSRITVRQLLNHTSGLRDAQNDPEVRSLTTGQGFLEHRYDSWTREQLIAGALRQTSAGNPEQGKHYYSNTNYTLAGMVIEKVTGRSWATEIERRIIRPLHLRSTRLPGADPHMPAPHSRAYRKVLAPANPEPFDVTEFNPSLFTSAGDLISTAEDLNRFYRALLGGRLLQPAQLAEMKTTVDSGGGTGYGLGLSFLTLDTCKVTLWGHIGRVAGSFTVAGATEDGSRSTVINFNSDWNTNPSHIIDAEFCS